MQTDTLYLAVLACPRRKLTRDVDPVFIATYRFFPPWAAQRYQLSRISRSTPNSVIDTIMTESQSTLNRLMTVVVGSCKEYSAWYSVGSPVDRHSAKCRASRLRSQDNLRSEAFRWGQPWGTSSLRSCRAHYSCPSAPRRGTSVTSGVNVACETPRTANGCNSRGRGHKAGEMREGRP